MRYNKKEDVVIQNMGIYIPPFRVEVDSLAKELGASEQEISILKNLIGDHKQIAVADIHP